LIDFFSVKKAAGNLNKGDFGYRLRKNWVKIRRMKKIHFLPIFAGI
jgi:hypothetical protein